jgi:hypothetical protein
MNIPTFTTNPSQPYLPSTNSSIGGGVEARPWSPESEKDIHVGTAQDNTNMMGHFANAFAAATVTGEGSGLTPGNYRFDLDSLWMNALSPHHASTNNFGEEERPLPPNDLQLQPGNVTASINGGMFKFAVLIYSWPFSSFPYPLSENYHHNAQPSVITQLSLLLTVYISHQVQQNIRAPHKNHARTGVRSKGDRGKNVSMLLRR